VSKSEGKIKIGTLHGLGVKCHFILHSKFPTVTDRDVRRWGEFWGSGPTPEIKNFCEINFIFAVCFWRLPWCAFCLVCLLWFSLLFYSLCGNPSLTFVKTNAGLYLPNYLLYAGVALQSLSALSGMFM